MSSDSTLPSALAEIVEAQIAATRQAKYDTTNGLPQEGEVGHSTSCPCDSCLGLDFEDEEDTTEPCPQCGLGNDPAGQLGQRIHYTCRSCGWWYSRKADIT